MWISCQKYSEREEAMGWMTVMSSEYLKVEGLGLSFNLKTDVQV
jgi:hypothetical protein